MAAMQMSYCNESGTDPFKIHSAINLTFSRRLNWTNPSLLSQTDQLFQYRPHASQEISKMNHIPSLKRSIGLSKCGPTFRHTSIIHVSFLHFLTCDIPHSSGFLSSFCGRYTYLVMLGPIHLNHAIYIGCGQWQAPTKLNHVVSLEGLFTIEFNWVTLQLLKINMENATLSA